MDPGRDLDYLHLQYACPALPRDGALSGTSPSSVLDALAFVSVALLDYGHCDKVRLVPGDIPHVFPMQCGLPTSLLCRLAGPIQSESAC